MIKTVVSAKLPADEELRIRKNRLLPQGADENEPLPRICIVTGIHGDELEGQYVCYELGRRIQSEPENLQGIVDIYPAMNPMGIDTIMRGLPDFDLDMNRIFPGNENGDMYEHIAHSIIRDLEGASLVVDIHASNIFLTEVPQIRINVITQEMLLRYASHMNMDLIWIHDNATVLESTLAYTMNSRHVPTLVVEMGVGMRITKNLGDQLVDGILETMRNMGLWKGKSIPVRRPVICGKGNMVDFLNAPTGGVFIKNKNAGSHVEKGDLIGTLVDPLLGVTKEEIRAGESGWLFTVREYPMVQEGSLLGRILKGSDQGTSWKTLEQEE